VRAYSTDSEFKEATEAMQKALGTKAAIAR
jgi:hypothetical protein